jgi:hypothetical protein
MKFGGVIVIHHNKAMLVNNLSIVVNSSIMANASLLSPNLEHDIPWHIIGI